MSHVLLSGDPGLVPDLRAMLREWGLTVGDLPADGVQWPDVTACDLVIHVGTGNEIPGAMPDGAQEAGGAAPAAAPLLVLGRDEPVPGAFETLPEPGPEGMLLRAAVARACRLARCGRGPDDEAERAEARQFLGHELRSPLAAVKTALDVLAREDVVTPDLRRMVDLAVRNVDRLVWAVDWSQDLHELEESPLELRPRPMTVAEMVAGLPTRFQLRTGPGTGGLSVLTDPAALGSALDQMARVMAVACPDSPMEIRLEGRGKGPLRLILAAEGPPRLVGGLQGGGAPGEDGAATAIRRLLRAMCCRDLFVGLGLRPRELAEADGRCGLAVELPAVLPAPARC